MNLVFAHQPPSIFETMSRLARETGAVNLGQGFPDDPGPRDVREKAADALLDGWNQYPPMLGVPELREAVAAHYGRFQGLVLDPAFEVMITSGATEALAGALLALIRPGDEVVLFEPLYDAYLPLVLRAGGIPRFVTLSPPHWTFTQQDLEAAFSPRTRVVLFNDPHNPTGTMASADQRALLARFCIACDAVVICDEVWEHVTFEQRGHVPLMTLPGMRERTVKIGSAGKIFAMTGWKVGFVMAAPPLLRALAAAHQFITFTTPPNLQIGVAYGLGKDAASFQAMRAGLQRSRDRFADGLTARGFTVLPCAATYFVLVDLGGREDDRAFCERLVRQHGVAAVPVSAFYAAHPVTSTVRFCFAKRDDTLDMALSRLEGVMR